MLPDTPTISAAHPAACRIMRSGRAGRAALLLVLALGGMLLSAQPASASTPLVSATTAGHDSQVLIQCTVTILPDGTFRIDLPCEDPCNPVTPLCGPPPPFCPGDFIPSQGVETLPSLPADARLTFAPCPELI
jgi:hypothetical protein